MAEEAKVKRPHNIILENRKTINISGVEDVESFDEQVIKLLTSAGGLHIKGKGLQIEKINIETGEMLVNGNVDSFSYVLTAQKTEGGFFSKMLR